MSQRSKLIFVDAKNKQLLVEEMKISSSTVTNDPRLLRSGNEKGTNNGSENINY